MKFYFIVICLCLVGKVNGQITEDSEWITSYPYPMNVFGGGGKTLPVYYYPFYKGVQLIEIGYYDQSLARGSHINAVAPHSGSSYYDAINRNVPNGFLLRNKEGKILENFGVRELKKLKLKSTNKCPISRYHKHRLNSNIRSGSMSFVRIYPDVKRRYNGQSGSAYILENENGYSAVDTFGVIQLKNYDYIRWSGGCLIVSSEGKCGLFNSSFKQLIPFKYSRTINWVKDDIFIAYDTNCTFINRNDVLLDTTKYESLRVANGTNYQFEYRLNGKHGLMDQYLNRMTEPIYSPIKRISERLYIVTDSLDKMAILNTDGILTTDYKYFMQHPKFRQDGYYEVYSNQAVIGYSGKREMGLIDTLGFERIAPKYERIGNFSDGVAITKLNDIYRLINKRGQELTRDNYTSLGNTKDPNCYRVELNQKWGLIDSFGNELLPITLTKILCVQDNMVLYEGDNGKYGYINMGIGEDIPPQFDFAYCFIQGIAKVAISGEHGLINKLGKEITGFKYDVASAYNGISGIVKKNGRWGVIDAEGNVIVPLKYKRLVQIDDNGLRFYNDDEEFILMR